MKGILKRPLALACGAFLLTLFLFVRTNSTGGSLPVLLMGGAAFFLAIVACVAGLLSSVYFPRLRASLFYLSALILAIAIALITAWRIDPHGTAHALSPYDGQTVSGLLTVEEVESQSQYSTSLIITLQQANQSPANLRGRMHLPYSASLQAGDEIELSFHLRLLQTDGTLRDCYALSQGITFEADSTDEPYLLLSSHQTDSSRYYEQLRLFVRRCLYPYLSDEEIGMASALLLGDKSSLSDELLLQFRNLGLSHTLAVSGLHLGILFCSLIWLFRKLGLPRFFHFPLLFPILFVYCAMVGSPSVLRAGGMLIFLFAAHPLGRMRDSVTSLFATVSILCILSPYSILDVGLLLSFFATWGILLIVPVFTEKLRRFPAIPRAILNALVVTLSATLFTMPFSVWYFEEWAILSPLANLLIVPIITLLLYLLPILCLLSPIPILAYTPAMAIRVIYQTVTALVSMAGSDHRLLLPLNLPVIEFIALVSMAIVILLCIFRKTRPLTLAVLIVFLTCAGAHNLFYARSIADTMTVHPISDGKNDCLLLQSGKTVLLIDRSAGGYDFIADAIAQGEADPLVNVDSLMLTRYHYRQISSLTRLLNDRQIKHLILPYPAPADEATARTIINRAEAVGCQVEFYSMESPCIGYRGYEILIGYYPDDAFRSITVSHAQKQLIYCEDSLVSADYLLPAQYGKELPAIDPAWNQVYDFSDQDQ